MSHVWRKVAIAFIVLFVATVAVATPAWFPGIDLSPLGDFFRDYATTGAAIVAIGSLGLLSYNSWMGWRRQKRQASMEAWIRWSDSTVDARRRVTDEFGLRDITHEQAQALLRSRESLSSGKKPKERPEVHVLDDIVEVLNGLERLAVGVKLGIYDVRVLAVMGGTTIVRSRERFNAYVDLRRANPDAERRQVLAFVNLDELVTGIDSIRRLDKERLRILRG